ncbi:MAG: DUF2232 domain-containing protein [Deltaproteobacteria bacterium]|nr:DUF2232 domain-containing protein [Deltaproteobacteria bacterium]
MSNTRAIISGACCAAALCVGGVVGPPGAALALLALPLPALVVGAIAGTSHAALSSLAAGGLVSGLFGWEGGATFLALIGVPGVVTVLSLRRAWRLEAVVAFAVAATLAGATALALLHAPDVRAWQQTLADSWRGSFDAALDMYRELGTPAERVAEMESAREEITQRVATLLPALFVVGCAALWLGNLGLSRRWASWPQLEALSRWRNADWVIWCLIGSGFAMFLPLGLIADASVNAFAVVLACYFAQGLSIVSFFLQRFSLPRGLRIATFLIIALQQLAAAVVVALGVFDLWGDFRHLSPRPVDAAVGPDSE